MMKMVHAINRFQYTLGEKPPNILTPKNNMNPHFPSPIFNYYSLTIVWNFNKRCKITSLPPGVISYPSLPSRKRLGIWTSLSVPSCTICIWASSFWASLSVIRTATAPAFSALIVLVTKEQSLQKHTSFIDKSYIVLTMQLQLWIFPFSIFQSHCLLLLFHKNNFSYLKLVLQEFDQG